MIRFYMWQKLLFKEALKTFFFFLFGFIFLWILIDYSINAKTFSLVGLSILNVGKYYLSLFAIQMNLLLPFAILLASIKVLLSLNQKKEMLILFSSGHSPRKIIGPLLLLGCLGTLLLLINTQFLSPKAKSNLQYFDDFFFAKKSVNLSQTYLNALSLKDGSNVIYQYFDNEQNAYFDLFLIDKEGNTITKMKYLFKEKIPRGTYVDIFTRESNGRLIKSLSHEETLFPSLNLDAIDTSEAKIDLSKQSLTGLAKLYFKVQDSEQKNEIIALITGSCFMPLLALLAVILPAPFCLKYSRKLPQFSIFAIFIFSYILFITTADSLRVVCQNNLLPPFLTQALFFLPLGVFALINWKKLQTL